MRLHLNTLYITTQGAYVSRKHQTLQVKVDRQVKLTVPLHHLDGIICFGRVHVSPAVLACCSQCGLSISFLSENGRYHARVEPPAGGNVLLRREQYRLADCAQRCLWLARPIVAAKIQNARALLLRAGRETDAPEKAQRLKNAARHMASVLDSLPKADSLDAARGIEGESARTYFHRFNDMIRQQAEHFRFDRRHRRPPKDPINAMLSFLYTLLLHDCSSALQAVGLDPAVGYLHADRPGRPSLALDLMEPFR
ncbi:MAG TPA: CRISPR-associated endonuclease Cas1, partial [Planctomycetaceae bacterium]|nr:CRISPR-associated endonuclease Cas1 [Planctomycetaceae bacterium]